MHAHMHRLQHKLGRSVAALGAGTAAYHAGKQAGSDQRTASHSGASKQTQADHSRPDGQAAPEKESAWKRAGSAVGAAADTKDKIADTAGQLREQAKDLPVNAKVRPLPRENTGIRGSTGFYFQRDPDPNCQSRTAETHRQKAADRPLQNAGRNWNRQNSRKKTASEAPKGAAPVHERPVTAKQPEDFRHHAGKPAMQPASPSIRERGQVPYGELWRNGLRFRW